MQEESPPQHFDVGDLVLVVNADYNPGLIGCTGTIARPAARIAGYDRFGQLRAGVYVVVDLPGRLNRHGTTLWYKKPQYLIKLSPDDRIRTEFARENEVIDFALPHAS
ncbi:MAG: hypothetical protein WD750_11685 [Gammaproteobacteria bacterium]